MAVDSWFDEICPQDQLWDSELFWNTTNPQLTQCFRQTILVWIPSIFLWIFAPIEGVRIARSKTRLIPWNVYNITRIIIVGICILTNLFDCLFSLYRLVILKPEEHPYTSEFSASLINIATLILLEILLLFHRWRGIHTSGIVWIYSLMLLICGFPTFYHYCFIGNPNYGFIFISYIIYYIMIISLFLLCCFADSPPKYKLPSETIYGEEIRKTCPEIEASFLSKLVFWWFNDIAITGYRKSLVTSDLWALNEDDKTNSIAPKFDRNWLKQLPITERNRSSNCQKFVSYKNDEANIKTKIIKPSKKQPGTLKTLISTFGCFFLSGAVFKLGHDLLQFINPLLLKSLITYVSQPEGTEPIWHGFFIAIIMFTVSFLQSLMLNFYFQKMFVIGMRIRTSLISAIYRKSLNLSNSARKESTVGEIVNLMSVDAQRFVDLLPFINLVWSAPLQIVIAMSLLYNELGASVFAGLGVMILLLPLNGIFAAIQRKFQIKQMAQKDERVKIINEVLNGIKVIKLYAWEFSFMDTIFKIRSKEIKKLLQIAYFGCVTTFFWTTAPFLVSLVTFAIYVLTDPTHVLDAQKAFVSLALFNLLRFPMTMLPQMITFIVMTSVSVKRLNKFLNSSELEKYVTRNEEPEVITIENGNFVWETKTESGDPNITPTLKDINFNVREGVLVAIVGSVGSGKSSFLSALLGEMERLTGRVNVKGSHSIAYCPQLAWIQNATLRDNILFGEKFDKKKYEAVIDACALRSDLKVLPGGDATEIGEKGINLSGGQKHRVALARACYSNADLYLLDDPLSAVDSHVAKHIFGHVLSEKKGFLKGKTRLLITNNLSILPKVDKIIVLKEGRISESGTYNELMDNKGAFYELVTEFSKNETEQPKDQGSVEQIMRRDSVISNSFARSSSIDKSQTDLTKNQLIEIEKSETGKVKFSIYMRYFKSMTFFWLLAIVLGMIGTQVASVGSSIWLSIWSSDIHVNGTQDASERDMRLGVYGSFGVFQAVFSLFAVYGMAKGSVNASNRLHKSLLERLMHFPMSFFDVTPIGRIVNRFSKDIDTVDSVIPQTIRGWLFCLLQVLATFVVIAMQTPIFLAVILPIGLLYYFIQKFYVATSRQLKRLESVTRSPIYSHFGETLSGVSTIRAYNATTRFVSESNDKVDFNQICYYPSVCANRWLAIRLEFCGNCITLFAAIFAVLGTNLTPGEVGLSITYALSVTQTLNWLVRMTSELETNIVSVERICEYCDAPIESEWFSDLNKKPPKEWPQNGAVNFVDYSTRYRPGLDLVLKQITLSVKPGEKVGIVGRTGAGKSSLTLSLFRLIEPASGKIVIDSLDVTQIGLHELRSKLTIIPQDPVLFSGTLRSNLDPFGQYTDEQLWMAVEHSHLKDFVKSQENQLEYKVTEGGENLSVGQRQLICLARALLRKTKILVLDEATAAVDVETDSLIQSTIRKEFSDCTIITIAHRLNTIIDSNRVLVLDQGSIAEFDTPGHLLENSESLFYSLAKDAKLI